MKDKKEKNPVIAEMGRSGGNKTKERYGKEHFIRISKLGKETLKRKREGKIEGVKLAKETKETETGFKLI